MRKNFEDIFESIKILHKKYNSKRYLENLENFDRSSKDLQKILEKYNTEDEKYNRVKSKSNDR